MSRYTITIEGIRPRQIVLTRITEPREIVLALIKDAMRWAPAESRKNVPSLYKTVETSWIEGVWGPLPDGSVIKVEKETGNGSS